MYYYSIIVLVTIISAATPAYSQSPYSITPVWYFGVQGKMTFPNGNFPVAGGTPTQGLSPTTALGVEASTSVSFKDGSVAVYTNTKHAFNGNPANADFNANITNYSEFGDNVCSGSATGGGVSFPDPARNNYPTGNIANDAFYVILANDLTGGTCGSKGLNRYRYTGTGIAVTENAGPTNIESNVFPNEALTVGTDGTGGYWVVTHGKNVQNQFKVWHYTAAGITGPTTYTAGADYFSGSDASQSYLKISPCQDKIAFIGGNTLTVHNFNRTTGAITGELRRVAGAGAGVGLEFSPDGNRVFYSGLGSQVSYVNIATGAVTTVTGAFSWTMQLGPDGKIYTSGTGSGNTNIGVISNPNTTATWTNIALPAGANIATGFVNEAWLSPETPFINTPTGSGCSRTVSFDFENYFNTDIPVNTGTIVWDFGDGEPTQTGLNPTHTFPASAVTPQTYTITVTFDDAACGHTWSTTRDVSISCPLPIQLLNFNGVASEAGVNLTWQTAQEINNDHFDLQRSYDGVNFESIVHLKGAGNSSKVLSYQYTDQEVTSGLVYYRLDQYDYDGAHTSSKIIAVQLGKGDITPISVAPNPFSTSFVLSKTNDEAATISVYDMLGRLLQQKYSGPEEKVHVLGESLSNGSYIVKYVSGANTYTLHLEKK